jgi:hypothetical protein
MAEKNDPDAFDIAAEAAEIKLVSLLSELSNEEKKGAMAIFRWHATNYLKAGHKRLGRILVKFSKGAVNIK